MRRQAAATGVDREQRAAQFLIDAIGRRGDEQAVEAIAGERHAVGTAPVAGELDEHRAQATRAVVVKSEAIDAALAAEQCAAISADRSAIGDSVAGIDAGDGGIGIDAVISPEVRELYLSKPASPEAFSGTAFVFVGSEAYHPRIDDSALGIEAAEILVIRAAGPVGYPGGAEVVNMMPPAALIRAGVDRRRADLAAIEASVTPQAQTPWQKMQCGLTGQFDTGAVLDPAVKYQRIAQKELPRDRH